MQHTELGDFLRARRDQIRPAEVGLPTHGLRRVPGLRREEVAILAGVSTDYYTKLEQGHGSGVSDAILDAVATVLRLDSTERDHVRRLARPVHGGRLRSRPEITVRASLQRLLDRLSDIPAVIVGPTFNALAWNDLADAIFDLSGAEETGASYAPHMFLDPEARVIYPEWESVAMEVIGYLRFNAGRDQNDPAIGALVGELSVKSAEFRSMWGRQFVQDKTHGRKLVHHALVGDLELDFETFRLPEDPRQALITYTAPMPSPAQERLQLLANWSAPTGPRAEKGQRSVTEKSRKPDAGNIAQEQ